jgi:hypothetical protein
VPFKTLRIAFSDGSHTARIAVLVGIGEAESAAAENPRKTGSAGSSTSVRADTTCARRMRSPAASRDASQVASLRASGRRAPRGEAITASIQSGLAQRDTRRAQRGQADLKATNAGVTTAPVAATATGDEDVLAKVELSANVAAVVEGEVEGLATLATKKVVRAKRPAVKAE